jgi:hypothetical protein
MLPHDIHTNKEICAFENVQEDDVQRRKKSIKLVLLNRSIECVLT